jgi:uncharacterized membrane protein
LKRPYAAWALGALFIAAGINHFANARPYEQIVPPGFPNPAALVAISGAAEIAGGVGMFVPQLRTPAAFGLIALLVAVFPANLNMALHPAPFASVAPAWVWWARLPLQPLLMWGVSAARRSHPRG